MPTKDPISSYADSVKQVLARANKRMVYDRLRGYISILPAYLCLAAIEIGLAYAIRHLIKGRDFDTWDVNTKYLIVVTAFAMLFLGVFVSIALYLITKTRIALYKNISKITSDNDETVKLLVQSNIRSYGIETINASRKKENIKTTTSELFQECINKSISGSLEELCLEKHFDTLKTSFDSKVSDIVDEMYSESNISTTQSSTEECYVISIREPEVIQLQPIAAQVLREDSGKEKCCGTNIREPEVIQLQPIAAQVLREDSGKEKCCGTNIREPEVIQLQPIAAQVSGEDSGKERE